MGFRKRWAEFYEVVKLTNDKWGIWSEGFFDETWLSEDGDISGSCGKNEQWENKEDAEKFLAESNEPMTYEEVMNRKGTL